MFPAEIAKLAKRVCKGDRPTYKGSEEFYGLFYNAKDKRAWLDGGCGSQCMEKILKKIGFSLQYVGETARSNNGETFYTMQPLTKHDRKYFY